MFYIQGMKENNLILEKFKVIWQLRLVKCTVPHLRNIVKCNIYITCGKDKGNATYKNN